MHYALLGKEDYELGRTGQAGVELSKATAAGAEVGHGSGDLGNSRVFRV